MPITHNTFSKILKMLDAEHIDKTAFAEKVKEYYRQEAYSLISQENIEKATKKAYQIGHFDALDVLLQSSLGSVTLLLQIISEAREAGGEKEVKLNTLFSELDVFSYTQRTKGRAEWNILDTVYSGIDQYQALLPFLVDLAKKNGKNISYQLRMLCQYGAISSLHAFIDVLIRHDKNTLKSIHKNDVPLVTLLLKRTPHTNNSAESEYTTIAQVLQLLATHEKDLFWMPDADGQLPFMVLLEGKKRLLNDEYADIFEALRRQNFYQDVENLFYTQDRDFNKPINETGDTLLHWYFNQHGMEWALKKMLACGADFTSPNASGKSPLDIAIDNKRLCINEKGDLVLIRALVERITGENTRNVEQRLEDVKAVLACMKYDFYRDTYNQPELYNPHNLLIDTVLRLHHCSDIFWDVDPKLIVSSLLARYVLAVDPSLELPTLNAHGISVSESELAEIKQAITRKQNQNDADIIQVFLSDALRAKDIDTEQLQRNRNLRIAVLEKRVGDIKALLKAGADLHATPFKGKSAFTLLRQSKELARLVLSIVLEPTKNARTREQHIEDIKAYVPWLYNVSSDVPLFIGGYNLQTVGSSVLLAVEKWLLIREIALLHPKATSSVETFSKKLSEYDMATVHSTVISAVLSVLSQEQGEGTAIPRTVEAFLEAVSTRIMGVGLHEAAKHMTVTRKCLYDIKFALEMLKEQGERVLFKREAYGSLFYSKLLKSNVQAMLYNARAIEEKELFSYFLRPVFKPAYVTELAATKTEAGQELLEVLLEDMDGGLLFLKEVQEGCKKEGVHLGYGIDKGKIASYLVFFYAARWLQKNNAFFENKENKDLLVGCLTPIFSKMLPLALMQELVLQAYNFNPNTFSLPQFIASTYNLHHGAGTFERLQKEAALWSAATNGKVKEAEALLKAGTSVSVTRTDALGQKQTLLFTLAQHLSSYDICTLLLEYGADPFSDGTIAYVSNIHHGSSKLTPVFAWHFLTTHHDYLKQHVKEAAALIRKEPIKPLFDRFLENHGYSYQMLGYLKDWSYALFVARYCTQEEAKSSNLLEAAYVVLTKRQSEQKKFDLLACLDAMSMQLLNSPLDTQKMYNQMRDTIRCGNLEVLQEQLKKVGEDVINQERLLATAVQSNLLVKELLALGADPFTALAEGAHEKAPPYDAHTVAAVTHIAHYLPSLMIEAPAASLTAVKSAIAFSLEYQRIFLLEMYRNLDAPYQALSSKHIHWLCAYYFLSIKPDASPEELASLGIVISKAAFAAVQNIDEMVVSVTDFYHVIESKLPQEEREPHPQDINIEAIKEAALAQEIAHTEKVYFLTTILKKAIQNHASLEVIDTLLNLSAKPSVLQQYGLKSGYGTDLLERFCKMFVQNLFVTNGPFSSVISGGKAEDFMLEPYGSRLKEHLKEVLVLEKVSLPNQISLTHALQWILACRLTVTGEAERLSFLTWGIRDKIEECVQGYGLANDNDAAFPLVPLLYGVGKAVGFLSDDTLIGNILEQTYLHQPLPQGMVRKTNQSKEVGIKHQLHLACDKHEEWLYFDNDAQTQIVSALNDILAVKSGVVNSFVQKIKSEPVKYDAKTLGTAKDKKGHIHIKSDVQCVGVFKAIAEFLDVRANDKNAKLVTQVEALSAKGMAA